MIVLLQAIRNVDLSVYYFLNAWAGNYFLDHLMAFEESNNLFKGGLFFALYGYVWFRPGPDQEQRRTKIIKILTGTLLALVASRVIADLAPFRMRPMYDLPSRPFSLHISLNMENWSSFPSDTASYFFALAYGLAHLVRRVAVPIMLYTAVWICLPRMFLGEHYASDMVVGAALGLAIGWASLRSKWLLPGLAARALKFLDDKPQVFYAVAFLVSFEMSVLFNDVRSTARSLYHAARAVAHGSLSRSLLTHPFSFLAMAMIVAYVSFWAFRRWQSARSAQSAARGPTGNPKDV